MLSHGIASGSDITPCKKINKPQVVYMFGNVFVMTHTTALQTYDKFYHFHTKRDFKVILMAYDK